MLRWFQMLMPKETRFFGLFARHAGLSDQLASVGIFINLRHAVFEVNTWLVTT